MNESHIKNRILMRCVLKNYKRRREMNVVAILSTDPYGTKLLIAECPYDLQFYGERINNIVKDREIPAANGDRCYDSVEK